MKPGPPKKPTAFRLVTGNPSGRPINKREPKPQIAIPEPPEWLSPYALEEWREITPRLARYRIISDLDRSVLILYCESFGDFRRAREALNQNEGLVITATRKDGSTYQTVNPFLSIANRASDCLRRCLGELGLTPASRSGITAGKDRGFDDGDPFGLFLD